MDILIAIATFLVIVLLIEGLYYTYAALSDAQRQRVRQRLQDWPSLEMDESGASVDILRRRVLSTTPWLHTLLLRLPLMQDIGRLLVRANSQCTVSVFLFRSMSLFFLGIVLISFVLPRPPFPLFNILVGLLVGMLPLALLYYKKNRRMQQFEKQLPEALDLVARALRAGHTFVVGMQMVGDEYPDPIGVEFTKTVDEISFGVNVPEALEALTERVECPDTRFFVTAVILQRDTGGNLAEILEKTSHLIRQRFELQGRIRVLSAEGRLSAFILIGLPFVVASLVFLINPTYLPVLLTDPIGQTLLGSATGMMITGIFVIKKMIKITV